MELSVDYFEVEGAVFRKRSGEALEIFNQKYGSYEEYKGDRHRIYMKSNPMTFDEIRPYMDVEPIEK